jgi:hypothetical protein
MSDHVPLSPQHVEPLTIKSAVADEIAVVIVERTALAASGRELGAAIVSVPIFALRGDALLVIGDNDILAGINITSTRNGAAAAPASRGKTLKATITIEYIVTAAGLDLNLGGPKVRTVLRLAMCGQH